MFNKVMMALAFVFASQFAFAGKIVVFSPEQAIFNTDLAKKRVDELEAKADFAQLIAQAEGLRSDLEALAKEEKSKGMTWGAEELAQHRKKREYVQADLKLAAQKLQAERNAVLKAIMEELQPKLEEVLKAYVTSEGIDMVLNKQVAYISVPSSDITVEVTKRLNKAK